MKTIAYRFWARIYNLGDAITPYILEELFQISSYIGHKSAKHLLATGSIFDLATDQSVIWGSGIMDPRKGYAYPKVPIHAVRGRLTRDIVARSGNASGDIALGDPGLLVSELPELKVPHPRRYRAVFVPHHSSVEHPCFRHAATMADSKMLDFRTNHLEPLLDIAAADVVVSESLHGLIFAAALGKPHLWVSTKKVDGWEFKYLDYSSTTENAQPRPVQLPAAAPFDLEALIVAAEPRPPNMDRAALLAAFPRELIHEPRHPLLPFRECRAMSPLVFNLPRPENWNTLEDMQLEPGESLQRLLGAELDGLSAQQRAAFRRMSEAVHVVVNFGEASAITPEIAAVAEAALNAVTSAECLFLRPCERLPVSRGLRPFAAGGAALDLADTRMAPIMAVRRTTDIGAARKFATVHYLPEAFRPQERS